MQCMCDRGKKWFLGKYSLMLPLKACLPYCWILQRLCSLLPACKVYQLPKAFHVLISTVLMSWATSITQCPPAVLCKVQKIVTPGIVSLFPLLSSKHAPREQGLECWSRGRVTKWLGKSLIYTHTHIAQRTIFQTWLIHHHILDLSPFPSTTGTNTYFIFL